MVRIRLRRVGLKKQPSYRIVVADGESPRDGRYIEIIGFYNPRTEPATMEIKEDRALYWLSVGAQPSEPVARILKNLGTQARYERMRKGEALEALTAEAEAERVARGPQNLKTRRPAPAVASRPKKVAQ
jgi:small subunit ribosomal protein S16